MKNKINRTQYRPSCITRKRLWTVRVLLQGGKKFNEFEFEGDTSKEAEEKYLEWTSPSIIPFIVKIDVMPQMLHKLLKSKNTPELNHE